MKARNAELDARIKEIEELLLTEQKDGKVLIDEKDMEIAELRRRQSELLSDYEELTKMKTTLEEEIHTYRRLLEGDSDKEGLKQVVEGIEERARQQMFNAPAGGHGGSMQYSFSIQSTSGGGRYSSANAVSSLMSSGSSESRYRAGAGSNSSMSGINSTKLKYQY